MSTPGWQRYLSYAVSIVGVVVFLLILIGRKEMMGTRYKVSETESVNYSGQATEEDARKTGEILKEIGFLRGEHKVDVLLKKQSGSFIVSFIVNRGADENLLTSFRQIGSILAERALGRPLTVRLLDARLNKKNEIKVE